MNARGRWWLFSLMGGCAVGIGFALSAHGAKPFKADPQLIERGRYLVQIAGCNDCHTPNYAINNGNVPEALWLTGDSFGWRGPWGTTYGTNLRLFMSTLTEEQWVETARTLQRRPPMPWFNLNAMHENDLRAIYHFARSLGDPGKPAPAALPPELEPATPHAQWKEGPASR